MSLHPEKCTMWCATSKYGLIVPTSADAAITNQLYLQPLQNVVILVIPEHSMWTQYFTITTVHAYIKRMSFWASSTMFGSYVLLNRFPESFGCGWSWPPCSRDMNPCDYFLWGYLKEPVYRTTPYTTQELQAEIETVADEIT